MGCQNQTNGAIQKVEADLSSSFNSELTCNYSKIGWTKVSGPKMRSKVKSLFEIGENWQKVQYYYQAQIDVPIKQMGATAKLEEK